MTLAEKVRAAHALVWEAMDDDALHPVAWEALSYTARRLDRIATSLEREAYELPEHPA